MAVCSRQEVEEVAGPRRGSYLQRIHSYQNGATGWGPSPESVRLWRAFRLWPQCLSLAWGKVSRKCCCLEEKGSWQVGAKEYHKVTLSVPALLRGRFPRASVTTGESFPSRVVAAGLCSLQCHSGLSTLHSKPHSRDLLRGWDCL